LEERGVFVGVATATEAEDDMLVLIERLVLIVAVSEIVGVMDGDVLGKMKQGLTSDREGNGIPVIVNALMILNYKTH